MWTDSLVPRPICGREKNQIGLGTRLVDRMMVTYYSHQESNYSIHREYTVWILARKWSMNNCKNKVY